jgi:glucose-1-phosphate thymidylyltransferase
VKVLILAAGYGTRLYPYTRNLPKPFLKVDNKPIIEYLLNKVWELDGVSEVIVVTNARFFRHFSAWKKGQARGNMIKIVNDLTTSPEERLGAIGDMNFVFSKETGGGADDFLVLGGDNFFEEPFGDFVRFARKNKPYISIGIFDIKNRREARHFGVVALNRQKQICSFEEKPLRPKSSLVATCLYYFPGHKVKLIKEYIESSADCCDAAGNYINWLIKKDKVYGFIFKKLWCDIGRIQTYKKLIETLTTRRKA